MRFFQRLGFIGTAIMLWTVSAIGFFGGRIAPPLSVLALPFYPLAALVLGMDEVQEQYGYWGEVFYGWMLSLPLALLYAWLIRRYLDHAARHNNA